jgi:hypothetical protein
LSEDRMPIETILLHWKESCGIGKVSHTGTEYTVIPIPNRLSHLFDLMAALQHYGYTKEDLVDSKERPNVHVQDKIVKTCWSDLIKNISGPQLKKNRDITRGQWEQVVAKTFPIHLPKRDTSKKSKSKTPPKEKQPEEKVEIVAKPSLQERIGLDTSDVPDAPFDTEFLKVLGIDESFFKTGKRNE